jgi:hypothetical protein
MTTTNRSLADLQKARDIFTLCIDQMLGEIVSMGGTGGSGRVQTYASTFVHLHWSRDLVDNHIEAKKAEELNAAKKAASGNTRKD